MLPALAVIVAIVGCGPRTSAEGAAAETTGQGTHGKGASVAAGHDDGHEAEVEYDGEVLSLDLVAAGEQVDILLARRGEPHRLLHIRSLDGGRSWGAENRVALGGKPVHMPHRGMDPQLAVDGDRLLAVWTAPGDSQRGSGPLATSYSDDGGRTWAAGANPADDGRLDAHNFLDAVATADGVFHAVWLDERDDGRGLVAASSTDGRSWGSDRTIDDHTCECCWNRVYAGDADELDVLYRDKLPTDLTVARSVDGGASWRRLGTPGGFGWSFEGCPHVGGALARRQGAAEASLHALAWTGAEGDAGLWASASVDGGASWERRQRLGSPAARHSDLAALDDRLVAVWDEESRIASSSSNDGGRTWGAPRTLSDPELQASHPLVAAVGAAAVVVWSERAPGEAWHWRAVRLEGLGTATPSG